MNVFKSKYVVVLNGSTSVEAIGPFDSKAEALDRAVQIVVGTGIDTFSTEDDIRYGIEHNTRNDVSVARLSPARTQVAVGVG